jgi:hypothetical protein
VEILALNARLAVSQSSQVSYGEYSRIGRGLQDSPNRIRSASLKAFDAKIQRPSCVSRGKTLPMR